MAPGLQFAPFVKKQYLSVKCHLVDQIPRRHSKTCQTEIENQNSPFLPKNVKEFPLKKFSWFRLWGKLIFDWLHQLCLFSSNSCLCLGTFFNPIKQPFIKIWTTLTNTTRFKYSKQTFWDWVGWGFGYPPIRKRQFYKDL